MKFHRIHRNSLSIMVSMIFLSLAGCETIPKDALKLSPESLERRTLQTRKYENISEKDILAAAAGVIQDLGFNIDESETKLGVIIGSKERDATEAGQVALATLLAVLSAAVCPTCAASDYSSMIDDIQKLRVSIVVRPAYKNHDKNYFVRVTFQRIVWNKANQISRMEALDEPEAYQEFFNLLSKAVFLEGHKI